MSRRLSDFNEYEAMEMFDLLQTMLHDNKPQIEGFYKGAYLKNGSPKRSIFKSAPSSDW